MSKQARVLVVDDDPVVARSFDRVLSAKGYAVITAANGPEALQKLAHEDYDAVFTDIRMPGMDGLEVAHHLARMPEPPAVIFTTAFEQHALAAFDAQAAGYLLKPVRPEKLQEALTRARQPTRAQLTRIADGTAGPRARIAVRVRDELRLIPIENVLCFIAEQKYTTLRHTGGDELIEESLKALEDEFPTRFVRVHRNSLVAIAHVECLERGADGHQVVRLRNGAGVLAVSRRLATEVARRLKSQA